MKMLPALAPDTSITENGHYLVRPVDGGPIYEVVNTITDEVDWSFPNKTRAEQDAVARALAAVHYAQPVE